MVNRKNAGLIQACKDSGVIPFCRLPLGKNDLASAVWNSSEPNGPKGRSGKRFNTKTLSDYEPLHSMQMRIAERAQKRAPGNSDTGGRELKDYRARKFEDKKEAIRVTPAMVAINYVVAKGGVPLVDVHDAASAKTLLGCIGWSLTDDEVEELEQSAELAEM